MKKRFSEEQIIKILKEHKAGKKATDLIREHNISEQTFYRWKSKYGGMEVSEAKRLKQLEDENRRLKGLVADLTLDNHILKDIISKNAYSLPTSVKLQQRFKQSTRLANAGRAGFAELIAAARDAFQTTT
ncbi:MAG: transposase, partial [Acholeplasmataceae bacterium]|nr:transposase [Acholeplasmataceae bacterium]